MKLFGVLTAVAVSALLSTAAFATGSHGIRVHIQTPTCSGTCTTGGAAGFAGGEGTASTATSNQNVQGWSSSNATINSSSQQSYSVTSGGGATSATAGGSAYGGSGATQFSTSTQGGL